MAGSTSYHRSFQKTNSIPLKHDTSYVELKAFKSELQLVAELTTRREHDTINMEFSTEYIILPSYNINFEICVDHEELCLLGCYDVSLVGTDVSEELSASIIRVTRIGELGTTLAVTSNR
jgi:hypothetical protein